MDIYAILSLAGGVALFLYGMKVMGDALEKQAGSKLNQILERLTSNPLKGIFLGAGVTAVIQSSTATTVMVVGFVNSGIMRLSQAISVIMGANIGTTATAWILSLAGIEGDSFFLKILQPSTFSPVIALVGVALILFSKSDRKQGAGTIMMGFAVLIFGLDTMTTAVQPLADVPEFSQVLTMFANPVLGVLTGMLVTVCLQSSSASVGLLQALTVTGSITYASAIPIIMGQNIGTCLTALVSSIGANKSAKRAAIAHLLFNVLGTVAAMLLFYGLNAIIGFSFLNQALDFSSVAVCHSFFNIFCTLLLAPFTKQLEKLTYLIVRDDHQKEHVSLLDKRLLQTPAFAIDHCMTATFQMADFSKEAVVTAISLVREYHLKGVQRVETLEQKLDRYEDKLGSYLLELSAKDLSMKDSQRVSELLHCIGDFERIGDHAIHIMGCAQEMHQKHIDFSDKAKAELKVMTAAVQDILSLTIAAFQASDTKLASKVEPLEQVIDELNKELKNKHIERLRHGECTIELAFILSELLTNYERIADHCSNVAACLIQIQQHKLNTHQYLTDITANSQFLEDYKEYVKKYALSSKASI